MRYRLTVSVPAGHLVVATGKLAEEHTSVDGYRATFVVERAAEPPSLFAGPYVIRETVAQGIKLRTYLHAELVDLADGYLQSAGAYIERYAAAIGNYPYADFHIVSAPLPVGLGFRNLTYVGRRVLPLPFMRTRSLAHEVLHNWWGNGVAVDYAGGNWSEGLTTYMADYALAVEQDSEQGQAMRVKWLRDYAALPPERDTAVLDFIAKRHQAAQVVGYNKVAFIFHMLAAEIGQDAFAAGLRRFWAQHAFETAGWQQLQAAFEHTSGRGLDWFFRQWLTRAGAPVLALGTSDVQRTGSTFAVRIEVQQSSPYYRLTLPVTLETRDGTETRFAAVDGAVTMLEFVTDSQPLAIHIDSFADVFRRLTPEETPPIMRDVTLHPAAITLIGTEEAAYGENARALAARLLDTEPRFGTVAQALETGAPVLLIADVRDAAELLARLQVDAIPALPEVAHSAAAWSARRNDGQPVLVVTAPTAEALRSLLRPLPHYGGRSYVLFDGDKAISRGVWPISRSPLRRELTR
jgi:aminopeptidase N